MVGPLTHSRLSLLPSTTITWGEWRQLYPGSRLLTGTVQRPDLFSFVEYGRGITAWIQDRANANEFFVPVDLDRLDGRLPSGEIVLTVEIGAAKTAFPLTTLGNAAVNEEVGGQPVAVFSRSRNRAAATFSRSVEGQTLTFDYLGEDLGFVDRETASAWDFTGRAVSGPLEGAQLEQLNTRRAFWFSVVIAFPDIDLYLP